MTQEDESEEATVGIPLSWNDKDIKRLCRRFADNKYAFRDEEEA